MITEAGIIDGIVNSPEVFDLGQPAAKKKKLCKQFAEIITIAIINSHEWDFAMDVADKTLVVDQAVYQLKGNDNDCRRIKSIRFGASDAEDVSMKPVNRKNMVDIDHYLDRSTPNEVEMWTRYKPKQKYPQVKLYSTPSSSGNVIRYRYWINGITMKDLELDDFAMVLNVGCRYLLNPALKVVYEDELKKAIENIQPVSNEPMLAMVDPQVVAQNLYRYDKGGY